MEEDAEQRLKLDLMQMDLNLKTKQAFWETPRNIAILVATVAAIAGTLGFKIGQTPPPAPTPIVIQLQQPPSR